MSTIARSNSSNRKPLAQAAGIVLSAVAVELVPEISEAESNSANNLAIVVGFVLGVGLFLFVGKLSSSARATTGRLAATPRPGNRPWWGSPRRRGDDVDIPRSCEAPEDDEEGEGGHGHDHSHEDQPKLVRKRSSKIGQMKKSASHGASIQQQARTYSTLESASSPSLSAPPYPTTLVLAVCVDAMVDGFLIGISAASGTNAGIIMAIALTVEMAFLSLTFAASLRPQSKPVFYVSVLMPPLALWLGGFIGATTATAVAAAPALHVGLISFGIAALLFLESLAKDSVNIHKKHFKLKDQLQIQLIYQKVILLSLHLHLTQKVILM